MIELKDLLQSADWKKEKHVPVIECQDKINKSELTEITVSIGKEIPHPNTAEHHIRWIEVYFILEGDKFPCQLNRIEFNAHGESIQGPNISTVYADPKAVINFRTDKPGVILVSSYCNIHGLWQNSKTIEII